MEHQIRPANSTDLRAVEGVVRDAYSHYVSSIGTVPGPMLDDYATLIEEGRVHVVEQSGAIQGIIVLIPQEDAMLLDNVAVVPAAQGSGLGRKMLEFAEQAAIDAGFTKIRLYTQEAMTANVDLYHRIGYRNTHRAEEKGLKRVYMIKDLAN